MQYFKISERVDELRAANGRVVGKGGDIIELALDSDDKQTLRQAQAVMLGNQHILIRVDTPDDLPKKKKKSKKKAGKKTYETREMTAAAPEPEPEPAPEPEPEVAPDPAPEEAADSGQATEG
jgi:hypothetical protein